MDALTIAVGNQTAVCNQAVCAKRRSTFLQGTLAALPRTNPQLSVIASAPNRSLKSDA